MTYIRTRRSMDRLAASSVIPSARTLGLALALAAAVGLAGCSNKSAEKTASADAAQTAATDGGFMTGVSTQANPSNSPFVTAPTPAPMEGNPPRFVAPQPTGQGAPSLASVPAQAPEVPSTRQDREKAMEGLIADRDRARYTDAGWRMQPVVVRPLTEAQAQPDEPAAPPVPQAASAGAVTRLGNQAAPAANAAPAAPGPQTASAPGVETAARIAATATPPALPEAAGPRPSNMPIARSDGFRALASFEANTSVANQVATVDFSGTGASISAVGRQSLSEAAQLGQRSKGMFRVIGRAPEANNTAQERATAVARELQRLGVAQDRIYVGTDTGQDGRVDVILDQ